MEYKTNQYTTMRPSVSCNSCDYGTMYSKIFSPERLYDNIIRYIPNTTHTGVYLKSN